MTLLDLHIIRAALYDARRLVEAGHAPEFAASLACRGVWADQRDHVLLALVNCMSVPSPTAPLHCIRRAFAQNREKVSAA